MFGRWYVGKRPEYESRLKLFHQDFLPIVEKIKETPEPEYTEPVVEAVHTLVAEATNQKPEISFDTENSILKIGDKKVEITLRNKRQTDTTF